MRHKGYILFPILLVITIAGIVGYFLYKNHPPRNVNTNIDITTPNPTSQTIATPGIDWIIYKTDKFSLTYPGNWVLETSVFSEGQDKVAEFSPGIMTLKSNNTCDDFVSLMKNGGEIEAEETMFSNDGGNFGKLDISEVNTSDINGVLWTYVVTKTVYEGGSPEWTGIWYPYHFCLTENGKMFLINFYSDKFPTDRMNLYREILSTLKIF